MEEELLRLRRRGERRQSGNHINNNRCGISGISSNSSRVEVASLRVRRLSI